MFESRLLKSLWYEPSRMTEPEPEWPARMRPLPDELLSSWLVRLAMAHGLKLHTFCSMAWPKKAIWNRDIDKSADDTIINVLAARTGRTLAEVRATTLSAYEGTVYEKHNPFGNTQWIMPIGVYHRTHRHFGLQFCAHCLAEDRTPYWRRKWRLAFTAICDRHGVMLHDRCPKCGAPVNFHRDELGNRQQLAARSLSLCYSCHFDLRKASNSAGREASDAEVLFQQKLLGGIEQGWIEIRPSERIYSHFYFMVMHQLLRLMTTGRKAEMMRHEIGRLLGTDLSAPFFSGKHGRAVERLNVIQRRALLIMGDYMLRGWPQNFITFCLGHRVWSSTLLKDFECAPFWFWQVVHDSLYRPSYYPSDEEVHSAVSYLNSSGEVPSTKAISKCLGVNNVFRKRKTKDTFTVSSRIPAAYHEAFQET